MKGRKPKGICERASGAPKNCSYGISLVGIILSSGFRCLPTSLRRKYRYKFTYKLIRTGRGGKITGLEFFISKNENYTDQLTLEEFIDLQPDNIEVSAQDKRETFFQNEDLEF